MKLNIPNVYESIELKRYAPEFGDEVISVLVNPTRKLIKEGAQLKGEPVYGWYAEIWSKGDDRWTADQVKELAEAIMDRDPGLWVFIIHETTRLISEHRKKKAVNII